MKYLPWSWALVRPPVKGPVNDLLGEVPAVKTRIEGLGPLKFLQWKQENFFEKASTAAVWNGADGFV